MKSLREAVNELELALYNKTVPSDPAMKIDAPLEEDTRTEFSATWFWKVPSDGKRELESVPRSI